MSSAVRAIDGPFLQIRDTDASWQSRPGAGRRDDPHLALHSAAAVTGEAAPGTRGGPTAQYVVP